MSETETLKGTKVRDGVWYYDEINCEISAASKDDADRRATELAQAKGVGKKPKKA